MTAGVRLQVSLTRARLSISLELCRCNAIRSSNSHGKRSKQVLFSTKQGDWSFLVVGGWGGASVSGVMMHLWPLLREMDSTESLRFMGVWWWCFPTSRLYRCVAIAFQIWEGDKANQRKLRLLKLIESDVWCINSSLDEWMSNGMLNIWQFTNCLNRQDKHNVIGQCEVSPADEINNRYYQLF